MKTKPLTTEQLAAIRARAEKATKGPWETEWEQIQYERWNRRYGEFHAYAMTPMVVAKSVDDKEAVAKAIEQVEADADFIANARTDIPALLDEVDRLSGQVRGKSMRIAGFVEDCDKLHIIIDRQEAELARLQSENDLLKYALSKLDVPHIHQESLDAILKGFGIRDELSTTHGLGAQGEGEDG
jgi:hypothetical protein